MMGRSQNNPRVLDAESIDMTAHGPLTGSGPRRSYPHIQQVTDRFEVVGLTLTRMDSALMILP